MGTLTGWGLWGTGPISQRVAEDFAHVPGAALRAVASRTLSRAEAFAAAHSGVRAIGGLDALLADPQVDVVYVASPNARHAEDCLRVIAAGKAVVCEKPFAVDAVEAARVVDAAAQRGVFCMEAMWTRFHPAIAALKAMLDRGDLGRVLMLEGNFGYATAPAAAPRLFDASAGGGVLLDRGVYLVSLAQHLLGSPVIVSGTAAFGAGGVDEQGVYLLGYASGAMATLSASLRARGSNQLTVSAERGSLCVHDPFYAPHRWSWQPGAAPVVAAIATPPSNPAPISRPKPLPVLRRRLDPLVRWLGGRRTHHVVFAGNGYQFELIEASRCIAAGLTESPVMPLSDTLAVMRTLDALKASFAPAGGRGRDVHTP